MVNGEFAVCSATEMRGILYDYALLLDVRGAGCLSDASTA